MSEEQRQPTRRPRVRHRLRYRFDNTLARGTWVVLVWLGLLTLTAVLASAALLAVSRVSLSGSTDGSTWEDLWQSLLRVLDPGTMAADVGWGRRLLALLVTIFGLLIAGTLIGIIANGVEQRVDEMRRGRSTVVEQGHVVVLGASDRLPVVVEQLALANRGRRTRTIVVLADREPWDLDRTIRASAVDGLFGSRLVIRFGEPARIPDLEIAAVRDARAVIVLADAEEEGDAGVVKAVLAAGAVVGGFDRIPIIAELSDPETGASLHRATGGGVHPIIPLQAVARITAFALREHGLSEVIQELLDYRGCEFQVREPGSLSDRTFGELVRDLEKVRPVGRLRADGTVELNPEGHVRLEPGERLIVIADDEEAASLAADRAPAPAVAERDVPPRSNASRTTEHLLVIGWNRLGEHLLASLEQEAAPGSTAEIVYDPELVDVAELPLGVSSRLEVTATPNPRLTYEGEGRTERATSVVLLGYRRQTSAEEADSRTLLNLMLLRRQLSTRSGAAPQVVVELRNADNVELARVSGADDYIVSDAIASRFMTQLSEQPERREILACLYDLDTPSLHLVPAPTLGLTGDVTFHQINLAAYAGGRIAIGWRLDAEVGAGMVLNPSSSTRVHLTDAHQIVVVS